MALLVVNIVAFIALSGLMAMVDAACLSVTRVEVEELVQRKRWGALSLQAIVQKITRGLVIIVLLTNTINILGPLLVGRNALALYGDSAIVGVTVVLTFGTIIFSEIIPKSLGAHYAPFIARFSAPVILMLVYLLYPLVLALEWVSSLFKGGKRPLGTEAQIRSLVTIGRRAGYIESDEGQLIHRAFILNDKTSQDVMTPLKDVAEIKAEWTIRKAAEQISATPYSRYPVFGKSIHQSKGMIIGADVLKALSEEQHDAPVESILRPVLTVPHDLRSDELLVLFRDRHIHLAVVHQDGKTVGLVTLEDVLEELVGEIEDERDFDRSTPS